MNLNAKTNDNSNDVNSNITNHEGDTHMTRKSTIETESSTPFATFPEAAAFLERNAVAFHTEPDGTELVGLLTSSSISKELDGWVARSTREWQTTEPGAPWSPAAMEHGGKTAAVEKGQPVDIAALVKRLDRLDDQMDKHGDLESRLDDLETKTEVLDDVDLEEMEEALEKLDGDELGSLPEKVEELESELEDRPTESAVQDAINDAVSEVKDSVETMESEVEKLDDAVDELKDELEAAEKSVAALNTTMATLASGGFVTRLRWLFTGKVQA